MVDQDAVPTGSVTGAARLTGWRRGCGDDQGETTRAGAAAGAGPRTAGAAAAHADRGTTGARWRRPAATAVGGATPLRDGSTRAGLSHGMARTRHPGERAARRRATGRAPGGDRAARLSAAAA